MKRWISLFLCLAMLSSCAKTPAAPQDDFYSFTDGLGQNVILTQSPQKTAVLFSSFAELWQIAGGVVQITVGESVERGFCESEIPLVDGGAGKTIDNEALLRYAPDFVIGSADIPAHQKTAELLQKAGIPCALMKLETFDDYLAILKIFTEITGNPEAYQAKGLALQQQIDALLRQTQAQASPKILFIRSGSKASSAKAKTAEQHFAAAMLEQLGAKNIADAAPLLMDGLSVEEILKQDPDYIFISTMGDEQAAISYMEQLLQSPAWQALSAVKQKNYHFLSKDLFQYKPNARWAESYQTLAEILYPELFQ